MKYKEQYDRDIQTAFNEFHANNPRIYELYKEQVYRAVRMKREKVSSKTILGWIRWEVGINVKTDDVFKINDAYTSRYARLFIKEHPQYEYMFNFRELRDGSEKQKPGDWDKYETEVLTAMKKTAIIMETKGTDAFVLIKPEEKPETITALFVSKLLKKKYIAESSGDIFTRKYTITKKGIKHLGGRTP